ncbi:MAG: transglycosylase domain-containing protein [Myxococcales bacterium]|nr:transglycosylase domain-containing protein [Myxococcales bacterium]
MRRSKKILASSLAALCAAWAVTRVIVGSGAMIDRGRFVPPSDSFAVVDRSGLPLRLARADGADRRWARFSEIPSVMVQAVLAAEDARFYSHDGVDRRAVGRAVVDNVVPGRRRSGGSTITQQLVKLVYGRPHGAWSKGAEALRAMSLERVMTKEEILEQYLNRLPYGDGIEGVARACESYFGHSLDSLSLSEAALLASIPRAPSALDPRRSPRRANERRAWVLGRMRSLSLIDERQYRAALATEPTIATVSGRPWAAPRFVDRVLDGVRAGTIRRESASTVRTSLDLPTQRQTETLLRAQWLTMTSRGARNAAAMVVSNATGEVLAYVGAIDAESDGGSLDLLDAERQPGSTLKPFAYELFFERGGTAATILDDVNIAMTGARGEHFEARDYDNAERGPVSARAALAASLNLAALDVARRVGQEPLANRLRALGFDGVRTGEQHGGALVLGGVGVKGTELAQAYATLARWGTRAPLSFSLVGGPVAGERVMHASHARVAWDVLSDPSARREGFGESLESLAPGLPFALKTGTSANWRDAWCAVATDRVTVLLWMGDPAGRAMAEVSGFRAAAPAAVRIAAMAHERARSLGLSVYARRAPEPVTADVCPWSGLRPGARCHHHVVERFAPGTVPTARCEQHDEHGDWIAPARLRAWADRAQRPGVSRAPRAVDASHGTLVVREPRDGSRWLLDPARGSVRVGLRVALDGAEVRADQWEVDGARIEGDRWTAIAGEHTVVAVVGSRRSAPSRVTVETTR